MYQNVIFDLDGTLLDTLEDLTDAGNWVCRQKGWPEHTTAQFRRMVGHGIPNLVASFSPPEGQAPEVRADTLERFSAYYAVHNMDKTCPYPGILEMVERLRQRGVRMAVYSNKADEFSRVIVEHFFPGMFLIIRGKMPGVPVKPDPAGIRPVLEALGAAAEETLFVGDSEVDMATARNAGMKACGVTWGFREPEELTAAGAVWLADTVKELEECVLR